MPDALHTSQVEPDLCVECGRKAIWMDSIAYEAAVKHDGKLHSFSVPDLTVNKCGECGEVYFTGTSNDQITAALREFLGLLQPSDIRRRLTELKLTQRQFAVRLGIAEETVSRWLNGTVVLTRALDNLMRLFLSSESIRQLLPATRPSPTLGTVELSRPTDSLPRTV